MVDVVGVASTLGLASPMTPGDAVRVPPPADIQRLAALDVLRALAALAVVACHVALRLQQEGGGPPWLLRGLSLGSVGLDLFIVLSGFCIHLAWCRGAQLHALPFLRRRLLRIWPPYACALLLYGVVHAAVWGLRPLSWWADLAWHLTMLHALVPATTFTIDGAFWTISLEWQLYVLYPLLLRLRTQRGWALTLGLCALARVAAAVAPGEWARQSAAAYLILWTLGALGAEVVTDRVTRGALVRRIASAWPALLVLWGAVAWPVPLGEVRWLLLDPLAGVAFLALVIDVQALPASNAAWLAAIGRMSYSVYLVHDLVVQSVVPRVWARFPGDAVVLSLLTTSVLTLGLAKLFFTVAEKPFLQRREITAWTERVAD